MASGSIPSTPTARTVPRPVVTPTTGSWEHPKFDEIARRQSQATFTDRNVKRILWNGGALTGTWIVTWATQQTYATRFFDDQRHSWPETNRPSSGHGSRPFVAGGSSSRAGPSCSFASTLCSTSWWRSLLFFAPRMNSPTFHSRHLSGPCLVFIPARRRRRRRRPSSRRLGTANRQRRARGALALAAPRALGRHVQTWTARRTDAAIHRRPPPPTPAHPFTRPCLVKRVRSPSDETPTDLRRGWDGVRPPSILA